MRVARLPVIARRLQRPLVRQHTSSDGTCDCKNNDPGQNAQPKSDCHTTEHSPASDEPVGGPLVIAEQSKWRPRSPGAPHQPRIHEINGSSTDERYDQEHGNWNVEDVWSHAVMVRCCLTPKFSCKGIHKRARGARSINSALVCCNARYADARHAASKRARAARRRSGWPAKMYS
jgi:hypothetical protein